MSIPFNTTLTIDLEDISFIQNGKNNPSFDDIIQPNSPPTISNKNYSTLVTSKKNSLIKAFEKSETPTHSINFFRSFKSLLIYSNGVTESEIKRAGISEIQELTSGTNGEVCYFLGTPTSRSVGCKVSSSEKRDNYINAMQIIFVKYLQSLSESVRDTLDTDESVMMQFTEAIKTLLYFYGRKSLYSFIEMFTPFFSEINRLFGREILRVTCEDPDSYTCGRIVDYAKCSESGRYFIVIDRTESTSNNSASASLEARKNNTAKTCGGRRKRKTRKQKYKLRKVTRRKV